MGIHRSALAAALLVALTARAAALVGPAEDGSAFEAQTVMVLKSAPGGASFCSGVVVARHVVLTAAHCVARLDQTRVHFQEGGRPALRAVAAIAVHPQYRAAAIATRERSIDLALVRTAEPLPARFSPARLSSGTVSLGMRLRIAGFGVAQEGAGRTSGVLRSGELVVRDPLSSILLWAEDPRQQGFGACTGDSGGPIFEAGGPSVVAITDWSAGSGRGSRCGRLTQGALVAPQRAWIDSILATWGAR